LARKVLLKHVADLSVQQGQKIIEQEINDEDHRRLVKTYIEEFGK
jgi:F0F1-type ATP synthase membrane subunit b/b'